MKIITVYSKPNCMQCNFTKRYLREHNIEFKDINVYENEDVELHVKSMGFQTLPVIEIEGQEPFFGFRPDKLEELK